MHLFIIILKEADTGFEHTKFVSVSFNLLVIQNHNIDGGGRYEGKDSIKLWQIIVKWAKKIHLYRCNKIVVREKGLEPPRRKAPDPKSGASANSATPASISFYIISFHHYLVNTFISLCFTKQSKQTIYFFF